jgi:hypothetical protein
MFCCLLRVVKSTWDREKNCRFTYNLINECANELNRQFSGEEIQMANRYLKKRPMCLAIKEMQIKTNHTEIPSHPIQGGHCQEGILLRHKEA